MTTATMLPLDLLFEAANACALLAWAALICLPRWQPLRRMIYTGAVLSLCLLYAVLIQVYFFTVHGAGFFSLTAVQRLFATREIALAGWVHYLAFDLFVGLWIARRADRMGLSRLLQAPVLGTTFMFGPIGMLMFAGVLAVQRWLAPAGSTHARRAA